VSQFRKLSQLLVLKTTYVWTYSDAIGRELSPIESFFFLEPFHILDEGTPLTVLRKQQQFTKRHTIISHIYHPLYDKYIVNPQTAVQRANVMCI
jgi:hypothetical protein